MVAQAQCTAEGEAEGSVTSGGMFTDLFSGQNVQTLELPGSNGSWTMKEVGTLDYYRTREIDPLVRYKTLSAPRG